MFNEYDVVRLRQDMPSLGLTTQQVGTIVIVYEGGLLPVGQLSPAYEVEFSDAKGATIALLTVNAEDIELVNAT